MTIQEAMKSGRPFKRKTEQETLCKYWIKIIVNNDGVLCFDTKEFGWHNALSLNDILATDWEIKP
jgi:hypothetical protein